MVYHHLHFLKYDKKDIIIADFRREKASYCYEALKLILALSTFPGRLQPSIIDVLDFTSVFEMGTGVSLKLYAPEIFQNF